MRRAARAVTFLALLTELPHYGAAAALANVAVSIDVDSPIQILRPGWLGTNIDTGSLTNHIDLTDPYLNTLARQIGAANSNDVWSLRVGGSAANGIVYEPNGTPGRGPHGSTVITDGTLQALNAFAANANARIIFCVPYQTTNGKWDPSITALPLWGAVGRMNLTSFWGWSLGNEIIGKAGFNNAQYAADYLAFAAAAQASAPAWAQALFGPSAPGFDAGPVVLGDFMNTTHGIYGPTHGAISLHAYAIQDNCTLAAYMNRTWLNHIDYYYAAFTSTRDVYAPGVDLYLEEMAAEAGGGCEGLSNRYVSGFFYVHALGMAAERGIQLVTRQDLVGWSFTSGVSHYTLAGPAGWSNSRANGLPTPHPDYFTHLLWRQLVGRTVLNATLISGSHSSSSRPNFEVDVKDDTSADVAVHAFCASSAKSSSSGSSSGAVVLAYINLGDSAVSVALQSASSGRAPIADTPRIEYLLTATASNMTADALLLNGAPLAVDGNGRLAQPIPGAPVPAGGSQLSLPPQSYGLVVLPQAGAPACKAAGNR